MTLRSNARVARVSFLLYIVFGITSMALMNAASRGKVTAAQLAAIGQHAADVRLAALLVLLCGFCALALGVSLYAITRKQDQDLAIMGLACRVAEGVIGGGAAQKTLTLVWLASA